MEAVFFLPARLVAAAESACSSVLGAREPAHSSRGVGVGSHQKIDWGQRAWLHDDSAAQALREARNSRLSHSLFEELRQISMVTSGLVEDKYIYGPLVPQPVVACELDYLFPLAPPRMPQQSGFAWRPAMAARDTAALAQKSRSAHLSPPPVGSIYSIPQLAVSPTSHCVVHKPAQAAMTATKAVFTSIPSTAATVVSRGTPSLQAPIEAVSHAELQSGEPCPEMLPFPVASPPPSIQHLCTEYGTKTAVAACRSQDAAAATTAPMVNVYVATGGKTSDNVSVVVNITSTSSSVGQPDPLASADLAPTKTVDSYVAKCDDSKDATAATGGKVDDEALMAVGVDWDDELEHEGERSCADLEDSEVPTSVIMDEHMLAGGVHERDLKAAIEAAAEPITDTMSKAVLGGEKPAEGPVVMVAVEDESASSSMATEELERALHGGDEMSPTPSQTPAMNHSPASPAAPPASPTPPPPVASPPTPAQDASFPATAKVSDAAANVSTPQKLVVAPTPAKTVALPKQLHPQPQQQPIHPPTQLHHPVQAPSPAVVMAGRTVAAPLPRPQPPQRPAVPDPRQAVAPAQHTPAHPHALPNYMSGPPSLTSSPYEPEEAELQRGSIGCFRFSRATSRASSRRPSTEVTKDTDQVVLGHVAREIARLNATADVAERKAAKKSTKISRFFKALGLGRSKKDKAAAAAAS